MNIPTERFLKLAELFRSCAFSDFLAEPATEQEFKRAEQELGCRLPASYGWFQEKFGNFSGAVPDIYTVSSLPEPMQNIVGITKSERSECFPNLPFYLIPFSSESGDSYCFDTLRYTGDECLIVFWDHEQDEKQTPEVIAHSFLDWLEVELNERQWLAV